VRIVGLVAVIFALALAVSANVPPLRIECSPPMSTEVCDGTVRAALRRGLVVPHPLILAARVDPGTAEPGELGHQATVTFDLLGMPFPTRVMMFTDMVGTWGAEPDHGWPEIPLWWAVPVIVLLGIGAWLFTRGWRTRSRTTAIIDADQAAASGR
jgi:hypothetical protein